MTETRVQLLARHERYTDTEVPVCFRHAGNLIMLHPEVEIDLVILGGDVKCYACNIPAAPREIVSATPWPEWDFDDRAHLSTLAEVEEYLMRHDR